MEKRESKTVIQSYPSAAIRGKLTTLQVRILCRIVERCQPTIKAQAASIREAITKGRLHTPESAIYGFTNRELTNTKSHNYAALKTAIKGLQEKTVQYYNYETKTWYSAAIIKEARIEEQTGRVIIESPTWLLEYICDFTHGATVYNLITALQLRKASSARLYMLLWGQKSPITWTIGQLRKLLGAEDKYTQTRDFIKRLIEPARQEMESRQVNGFSYKLNKTSEATNATIKSITFTPITREAADEKTIIAKVNTSSLIPAALRDYLITALQFTSKEIGANKELLHAFTRRPQWQEEFGKLIDRARRKRKGKGYIINGLKGIIAAR